jgi:predicted amidohydrolase YtcJ
MDKNRFRFFLMLFIFSSCSRKERADLIIVDAKVYKVDSGFSMAEAFAVRDGKIIGIGRNKEIQDKYSSDSVVDVQGRPIYPGFIDAHAHFLGYARKLFIADLYDSRNFDEVLERLKKFSQANPGEQWILGRGWDQNKWPGKSYPDNEKLNALFPDRPVYLERVDGHAAIVNGKALEIANIKAGQGITGGEIETKKRLLTGILIDNATRLVSTHIPGLSKEDYEKRLLAAQKNCFATGLTTITDCGLNYRDVDAIDSLQKEGKLDIRLYIMLSDEKENFDHYLPKGPYKTDRLFVKGFKFYADGALGSRGACLLQPYTDKAGWFGFLLESKNHYDSMAAVLAKTDFQMCTHAIGDSGNRQILLAYTRVLQGKNDRRWRIEHAQVIDPSDFNLFGNSSIIPSVQPTHATSDMYWAADRLGEKRLSSAYAYKKLLQQNGWIPLGTDFPVEDISPFKTFFAAVFRKDSSGFPAGGFQMENALSREEALRGMTIWAAKADFLEQELGSLETGKKADFIILDKDLLSAPESDILHIRVIATYSGGKKVYGLR